MPPIHREIAALVSHRRWAALATSGADGPHAAMVAYALEPPGGLLLFLSQLAAHTTHLLADPRASLVVSEEDDEEGDPQRLARVTLCGRVEVLRRGTSAHDAGAMHYVDRFPDALPRFELGDFVLFRFQPDDVRYVGGLARTARATWREIVESGSDRLQT